MEVFVSGSLTEAIRPFSQENQGVKPQVMRLSLTGFKILTARKTQWCIERTTYYLGVPVVLQIVPSLVAVLAAVLVLHPDPPPSIL